MLQYAMHRLVIGLRQICSVYEVAVAPPAGGNLACEGQPPDVQYPVCNVETGEWYALSDEDA